MSRPPSGGFFVPGEAMLRAIIIMLVVAGLFGLTAWLAYLAERK